MKDSRASGIDDAAFYARRSERGGPVHPSFGFDSIKVTRGGEERPAESAPPSTESPRRSMASPVPRARRPRAPRPTPADDFISRLAAAEQRLKHAADGARD